MRKSLIAGLAGALALAMAGVASAGSTSENMNLTLTVTPECLLSVSDTLAEAAGVASETQLDSSYMVMCNQGTAYNVEVDQGQHFGAATDYATSAALTDGTNFVAYNLFQDSGLTTAWGTGANAVTGVGNGDWQVIPFSWQILVNGAPNGTYTDTVAITVSWDDV